MAYSVSASFAAVFLGLLVATATFYAAADNAGERLVDAGNAELEDELGQLDADFEIERATYYAADGLLLIDLDNAGSTHLSVSDTDVLIDGRYHENFSISRVDGDAETDLWEPDETIHLEAELVDPGRLKVVVRYGIARFSPIVRRNGSVRWPMFGYDAANTGRFVNTTGPTTGVGTRWNETTGGDVVSSPAVTGGTLYVGSNDSSVYALDTAEGEVVWSYATGGAVESSPAAVDGVVYVGSVDGEVYALDAGNGSLEWSYSTGGAVRSSPTVHDGVVYVGSDDGEVYAIDAADGTEKWSYSTAGQGIDNDLIGSGLLATDGGAVRTTPAVYDASVDTVYVGTDGGGVHAIYADNGSNRWTTLVNDDRKIRSSGAVANDTVFIGSIGTNLLDQVVGQFYALDAHTGSGRWSEAVQTRSSPAVADGTVYVPDVNGSVHALATADGTPTWPSPFDMGNTTGSSPAVVNDTSVYVADDGGMVYGIDVADGSERWRHATGGSVASSPAVVDGVLYVGNDADDVYAIEES